MPDLRGCGSRRGPEIALLGWDGVLLDRYVLVVGVAGGRLLLVVCGRSCADAAAGLAGCALGLLLVGEVDSRIRGGGLGHGRRVALADAGCSPRLLGWRGGSGCKPFRLVGRVRFWEKTLACGR